MNISKKAVMLTYIILISLTIENCANKEPVLATVGTSKLTKKELLVQIPSGVQLSKENIDLLIDKWINTELLYQEAKRQKLEQDETLKIQLNQLKKELVVNKLLEKLTENITVSKQEVFDYFTKHKEEFLNEVKIMRIVVPDENLANQALQQLRAGADFSSVAKDISIDRVLEKGAESKYLARGFGDPRVGGDPALEEAIFALNPGQISDVIKTQEGYQIIKVTDKKKVKKDIALSEVEDYINSIIQYRKSKHVLDSILTNLKTKAK
ncbi:MAG: peptidyl-prolyl cis-trans isomerase, partial [candidate division WOR-3 bacterium]